MAEVIKLKTRQIFTLPKIKMRSNEAINPIVMALKKASALVLSLRAREKISRIALHGAHEPKAALVSPRAIFQNSCNVKPLLGVVIA